MHACALVDRDRRSPSLRPPLQLRAQRRALLLVHVREADRHAVDARHGADVHPHLRLEVRLERAARDREPDRDVHVLAVDIDRVDHSELDDVAPQLGIDDLRERSLERVGGRAASRRHATRDAPRTLRAGRCRAARRRAPRERVVAGGDDARAARRGRAARRRTARVRPAARRRRRPRAQRAARRRCRSSARRCGRRLATASTRPSARWQRARASEPSTRTRSTSPGSAAAAGARCSGRVASSATSCRRASGRDDPSAHAVDGGAAAAPRDPLLAVAEVVDVAERDVAHRRAVGDRDRERVERQSALGVEAAVDRIDDDAPAAAAAEAALADLLRDDREALAVGRRALRARASAASSAAWSIATVVSPPAPRPSSSARRARGTAATAATTPSRMARQTSSQRSAVTGRTDRAG